MKYRKTASLCAATAAALTLIAAGSARAGSGGVLTVGPAPEPDYIPWGFTLTTTTTILNPYYTDVEGAPAGEDGIRQIFTNTYGQFGGAFHYNGYGDLTNGTISAHRVHDDRFGGWVGYDPSITDIDQIFTAPDGFTARMLDVTSEMAQDFGYFDGTTSNTEKSFGPGANFNRVFHVRGKDGVATKNVGEVHPTGPFRFGRGGPQLSAASSQNNDNADGRDHMITYVIEGLVTDQPVLALFFEDINPDRVDDDFQDLVVEVRGASVADLNALAITTATVPTPAAFTAGLAMLGGMLLRRRRRDGGCVESSRRPMKGS